MTPSWIIVHHTASPRDTTTFAAVNEYHRTKNWGTAAQPAYASKSALGYYLSYHYFITADGTVTQAANENELRWHAGNMNDKALGVCMAGWFDDGHDAEGPTQAQVTVLTTLLNRLAQTHNIGADKIVPHRKFAQKSCYGFKLADDWAAKLITAAPIPTPVIPTNFPVYKHHGAPTLYLRAGNVLMRFSTDYATYLQDFGNIQIIELSDMDFAKLTVAHASAITKI